MNKRMGASLAVSVAFISGVAFDRLLNVHGVQGQSVGRPPASLKIGTVTVTIGMTNQELLGRFKELYSVATPDKNRALIWTKPVNIDGVSHSDMLGEVRFEADRVSQAYRNWGSGGEGAQVLKLWESIFGLMTTTIGFDQDATIAAHASVASGPDARFETIDLRFGNRGIQLEKFEHRSSAGFPEIRMVTVREAIF
jgi:hypothetical protein